MLGSPKALAATGKPFFKWVTSAAILLIGFCVVVLVSLLSTSLWFDKVAGLLLYPYYGRDVRLITTSAPELFLLQFKVVVLLATVCIAPVALSQILSLMKPNATSRWLAWVAGVVACAMGALLGYALGHHQYVVATASLGRGFAPTAFSLIINEMQFYGLAALSITGIMLSFRPLKSRDVGHAP